MAESQRKLVGVVREQNNVEPAYLETEGELTVLRFRNLISVFYDEDRWFQLVLPHFEEELSQIVGAKNKSNFVGGVNELDLMINGSENDGKQSFTGLVLNYLRDTLRGNDK